MIQRMDLIYHLCDELLVFSVFCAKEDFCEEEMNSYIKYLEESLVRCKYPKQNSCLTLIVTVIIMWNNMESLFILQSLFRFVPP